MKSRMERSAKAQENDAPAEKPEALLEELEQLVSELVSLIQRVNRTNVATTLAGDETLADALAVRDGMLLRRKALSSLADAASIRQSQYTRSEIRFVSTVDVASLQRQIDAISRDYRELGARIQQANWQVELID